MAISKISAKLCTGTTRRQMHISKENKMKEYISAEMEIILIQAEDIITESGPVTPVDPDPFEPIN
jgi:hypothetical protein